MQRKNNCVNSWKLLYIFIYLHHNIYSIIQIMAYSKTPITVINATPKMKRIIDELRANKRTQVEKLRSMKPEEFSLRITL